MAVKHTRTMVVGGVLAAVALLGMAPAVAQSDTTAAATTTITPSIGTPTSLVNTSFASTTQPTVLGTQVSNDPLAHTGRTTHAELVVAVLFTVCGFGLVVVSRRARRLEPPGAG